MISTIEVEFNIDKLEVNNQLFPFIIICKVSTLFIYKKKTKKRIIRLFNQIDNQALFLNNEILIKSISEVKHVIKTISYKVYSNAQNTINQLNDFKSLHIENVNRINDYDRLNIEYTNRINDYEKTEKDIENIKTKELTEIEEEKKYKRYDVINFLIDSLKKETKYLEIGVRNPNDNFNKINAIEKYSVDPGVEFKKNPVDFKLTSDEFFHELKNNNILDSNIKFDVIFIDGLHLADQVNRDIKNCLKYISDDGYIVLHDCNPPTEWHARENYMYFNSPAGDRWNGTTWKAFIKWRNNSSVSSICIDTDWGIGIISKNKNKFGNNSSLNNNENDFYEFKAFDTNKKQYLNLIEFDDFKKYIN
jgi:hypothetical protein